MDARAIGGEHGRIIPKLLEVWTSAELVIRFVKAGSFNGQGVRTDG
jgi:hypothetical protein